MTTADPTPDESSRPAAGPGVGSAWLAGIVVAVATTWPLVTVMWTDIPAQEGCRLDCADSSLCAWIVGFGGRQLYTNPLALFDAPIFQPFRLTFAYSETLLAAAAMTGPVTLLTGNPIFAYDAYVLVTSVLGVVGMFLLVREIGRDARAALAAGVLFGMSTEFGFFWGFPPAVSIHWAPFLLWAWLRFVDAPSWRRGLVLGALLVAHMHSGVYHGLMLPALLPAWAAVLAIGGRWPLRRWILSAVPLGVAGVAALALYRPYAEVADEMQYVPTLRVTAQAVHYWSSVLHPFDYVQWRIAPPPGPHFASPLAAYLLVAAGLVAAARPRARPADAPRLGVHIVAALALMLLAVLVSLGPVVSTPFGDVPGPFTLLDRLPGFSSMRALVRFGVLAALGRAILAGIAITAIVRRLPPRAGLVVCGLVIVAAAADARLTMRPTLSATTPPEWRAGYAWLAAKPPETAVLELPYGSFGGDARYQLHALGHRRRLMNGYSAMNPRFTDVLRTLPGEPGMRMLADAGVGYVLVHPSLMVDSPFLERQLVRFSARSDLLTARLDDTLVFHVQSTVAAAMPPLDPMLPREGWRVEASAPGAERSIDGDLATHWTDDALSSDGFLRVDLGADFLVTAVVVGLGSHLLEYPRAYELRASSNGVYWQTIGRGDPTLPPLASYRGDHSHVELRLPVRPTRARWIELDVARYEHPAWSYTNGQWGVHELDVRGTP
jgi:hypothetical protein